MKGTAGERASRELCSLPELPVRGGNTLLWFFPKFLQILQFFPPTK